MQASLLTNQHVISYHELCLIVRLITVTICTNIIAMEYFVYHSALSCTNTSAVIVAQFNVWSVSLSLIMIDSTRKCTGGHWTSLEADG